MSVLDSDDRQKIRDLGEAIADDRGWEALGENLRQLLGEQELPCTDRAEQELRDHLVWLLS